MYSQILLPIDLGDSTSWDKALPTAVEYCRVFGSRLHITTVVPDFGMALVAQQFPADYADKAKAEAERQLEDLVKKAVPSELSCSTSVRYGRIYEEVLETAKETKCDLIVMASHKPGLADYLLGPNAARVVRHASCSVLVVRA
jgi:nucleotide-binding universal stress UspA family protein